MIMLYLLFMLCHFSFAKIPLKDLLATESQEEFKKMIVHLHNNKVRADACQIQLEARLPPTECFFFIKNEEKKNIQIGNLTYNYRDLNYHCKKNSTNVSTLDFFRNDLSYVSTDCLQYLHTRRLDLEYQFTGR